VGAPSPAPGLQATVFADESAEAATSAVRASRGADLQDLLSSEFSFLLGLPGSPQSSRSH